MPDAQLKTKTQVQYNFQQDKQTMRCVVANRLNRFYTLYSPYDCRVVYSSTEEAIFGRGSLCYAHAVLSFNETLPKKPWLTVGRISEIGAGCRILLGGEHDNAKPINSTFGMFRDMRQYWQEKGVGIVSSNSRGPVRIGNNVTISTNVTILSGITIGDGAVIGAGSVVTKDIPPFAIAAGNPAKVIRQRFTPEVQAQLLQLRWWDFTFNSLFMQLPRMQHLTGEELLEMFNGTLPNYEPYAPEAPLNKRLVFQSHIPNDFRNPQFALVGCDVEGKFIPREQSAELHAYAQQMDAPDKETIYASKNLFACVSK